MRVRAFYIGICCVVACLFAKAQVPPVKWQKAINTDTGRVIYEPSGAFDQVLPPNTVLLDIRPLKEGGYMSLMQSGNGLLIKTLLVKINSAGDTVFTKKVAEYVRDGAPYYQYGGIIFSKMEITADGDVVILGMMYGSNRYYSGPFGFTMCKYSSEGELIWKEQYKGGSYLSPIYEKEYVSNLLATPDGGFLIVANSNHLKGNDKSEDPVGPVVAGIGTDYWVIKTGADGVPEWDKTIGGSGVDEAASAINTLDGGYIIAGVSASEKSGNKSEDRKGGDQYNYDLWLVKLNASGVVVWDKTVGTAGGESQPVIKATKDGGFLVTCATDGGIDGDKTEGALGRTDIWALKFIGTGNIEWQNTLGSSFEEEVGTIMEQADGGFLLGLGSMSDVWLVKLSAAGVIDWQSQMGGTGSERNTTLIPNADGTILLACNSSSDISGTRTVPTKSRFTFEGTEYTGNNDVWLVLFDVPTLPVNLLSFTGQANNGHALLQWKTATETNSSHFELEKSFDGEVFTKMVKIPAKGNAGQYNYTDDFNSGKSYYRLKMVDKDGSVKYSNIVVINAINYTNVTIAPNPVTGNQQLVMSTATAPVNAMWQIVGTDGRIYASQKVAAGSTQVTIDTKALVSGTYSLVYSQGNSRKVLRFVKQ